MPVGNIRGHFDNLDLGVDAYKASLKPEMEPDEAFISLLKSLPLERIARVRPADLAYFHVFLIWSQFGWHVFEMLLFPSTLEQ